MQTLLRRLSMSLLLMAAVGPASAVDGVDAYRALGLEPREVLSGTVMSSRVVAGHDKQVVCLVTYLTGSKMREDAVNVKLGVFDRRGDTLVPLFVRDFGKDRQGNVGNGDLELIDLDQDAVNEIIVSYETFDDPLIEQRMGEVIGHRGSAFETRWSGVLEYDATRAARSVPLERRDRFVREIDLIKTLRTRGITLFVRKRMISVAGERLDEPAVVQETFPLGHPADG